jgi:hypothetical protein
VNSSVYTLTIGPNDAFFLDQPKWIGVSMAGAPMPTNGFIRVEGVISGQQYGVNNNPYPKHYTEKNDLRLAAICYDGFDFQNGFITEVVLTNDRVYAAFQRLPFARGGDNGNYWAFAYMVPVANRKANDWHTFSITYDDAAKTINWIVDGASVLTVGDIGLTNTGIDPVYMTQNYGGTPTLAWPQAVNPGFGNFAMLGAYPPSRKVNGQPVEKSVVQTALVNYETPDSPKEYNPQDTSANPAPATFYDNAALQSNRLFGQGAVAEIKQLKIATFEAPVVNSR